MGKTRIYKLILILKKNISLSLWKMIYKLRQLLKGVPLLPPEFKGRQADSPDRQLQMARAGNVTQLDYF